MKEDSEERQTLINIQHEWARARIENDRSYIQRLEADSCTVVWPDGTIVEKEKDVATLSGDVVFTEFKIDDLRVRLYAGAAIVIGRGSIAAEKNRRRLLRGEYVWTDTFIKENGQWKVVASQITPVLRK